MKYDVIVVGSGPAAIVSAVTAKKYYPEKSILVIKSIGEGVVPCGIPYMFTKLEKPEDNLLGNAPLEEKGIDWKVDEVIHINKEEKEIHTKNNESFEYEKLILAVGSNPIIPPIDGSDKKGIYAIRKEMNYLKKLKEDVYKAKDIVIIGGGFIGIEFADELSLLKDTKVTIVELMPDILANSFDKEFSNLARDKLAEKGINLITGKKVVKFNGNVRVESITLSDNTEIPCQVVILGTGALPNTDIAKKAGLDIGKSKGILVDEYLRTYSDTNIFAVGDCAEKKDFFTRKKIPVMLASTACAEARIAGANLFELKVLRENRGTIATYSTKIGNLTLGSAGLTERAALEEGFEIIVGNAEGLDKHPGAIPNANKVKLKLIFSKQSGIILGGQVAGGDSAGELVNIIGLALQKNTSLTELETLQIATHPKLTAAPTMYPLIVAAQDALSGYKSKK